MLYPSLFIADLHAQKNNLAELKYLFQQELIVSYNKYKCKSLVIVGDILHAVSVIDTEVYITVYHLIEEFHKQTGAEIHIIAGNHDMYMVDAQTLPPIDPFKTYAHLHLNYDVEDDTEFIAYGAMPQEVLTKRGVTFVHNYLPGICEELHLSYAKNIYSKISASRLYLAGHTHTHAHHGNEISIGCPIPIQFDFSEFNNYYGVINENYACHFIPCHIASFNIFNVKTAYDLSNIIVKKGIVSTWVKLKLQSAEITATDIREFKANNPDCYVVTTKDYQITELRERLNIDTKTDTPLEVYRAFITSAESTPFEKREIWNVILEIFKERKANEANRVQKATC